MKNTSTKANGIQGEERGHGEFPYKTHFTSVVLRNEHGDSTKVDDKDILNKFYKQT